MSKKGEIKTILGIDTSCDETSVAIVEKTRILANVISSQVELHRKYGGVVPMIAKREHEANLPLVIAEAFTRACNSEGKKISWKDIDAIAVTYGPGLAIALEVGIKEAKALAEKYDKPLIAVNHMEGHLLSSLGLNSKGKGNIAYEDLKFPVMGLLVSGGHTELILMRQFGDYEILGRTVDDAIGEAYDKVARMLGLGYPGGKVLTEFAKKGDSEKYTLPIPMSKDPTLNFSYSGLKTALFYLLREKEKQAIKLSKQDIYDYAASFEKSACAAIEVKLKRALKQYQPNALLVGGGVAASVKLRRIIRSTAKKFNVKTYFPVSSALYTDNGAMIAIAGYFQAQRQDFADADLDRNPNLELS